MWVIDVRMRGHPLEDLIKQFGSEAKLAQALGFSQHAVWHAKKAGRVSPKMAIAIHKITRGKVNKADLRPDIFGDG